MCMHWICAWFCVRSHVSRSVWSRKRVCYLSLDLISVSRYRSSADLWRQWRGLLLQDSHTILSTNSTLHFSTLPVGLFFCNYRSVYLKLGGQLSKMITLCIKHAAVSNLSSPSSVFYPQPLSHCFFADSMGEEHHTWGTSWIFTLMVVVCIHWFSLSLFLFLDHTQTHTHTFFQQLTFILS